MSSTSLPTSEPPRYSLPELERRFLVRPDFVLPSPLPSFRITDHYLTATRLRLRQVENLDSGELVFKLCKKYPSDDPLQTPITNLYLSTGEYEAMSGLPASRIRKVRHHLHTPEGKFGIDVFELELSGLRLAEVSLEERSALLNVPVPSWALREVTDDRFFQGGNLAGVSAGQLAKVLS